MAYNYTTRNGQRIEISVAAAFDAMAAEFKRVFGLDLIVSSGTRTRAEQQYLYDGWINRRPGFNLAAKPGQSNHEEFGPIGPIALDLRDSGSDAGVTVIGSKRSNWLAANCGRWGFTNAGHYFSPREGWHYEKRGSFNSGTDANGKLIEDGEWGAATTRALQTALGVNADGEMGPITIRALQTKLVAAGHRIDIDGEVGPATIRAMQVFLLGAKHADGDLGPQTIRGLQFYLNVGGKFVVASKPATGKLTVDGDWGPATTKALQKVLGVTQDGELGPQTYSALQKALGVTVDGEIGPQTRRALQVAVGATVDGETGPETVRKLQEFLNAGKKFTKVTLPTTPKPTTPTPTATPRTPRYPKASRGWNVPLSSDRDAGSVIDRFIIHHTTNLNSEEAFFKTKNSRSSCPTWYVESNGNVIEMIDPAKRPSATGSANTRSVSVETQNTSAAPSWGISEASHESIAQIVAWFHMNYHGKTIDGFTVDLPLDRTHVIGHNEAGVNATACPGPSMNLDEIVVRAREIALTQAPVVPEPNDDEIVVKRTRIQHLLDELKAILGK
ncbi:N-acetylmuramoyl-L-alanine amidase [Microbacterium sp. GXF6406]